MEDIEETKLFRYFTTVRDLKELDELVKYNKLLQPGDIVIVEENRYSYMICADNKYILASKVPQYIDKISIVHRFNIGDKVKLLNNKEIEILDISYSLLEELEYYTFKYVGDSNILKKYCFEVEGNASTEDIK
jgi:hypothetical protein